MTSWLSQRQLAGLPTFMDFIVSLAGMVIRDAQPKTDYYRQLI